MSADVPTRHLNTAFDLGQTRCMWTNAGDLAEGSLRLTDANFKVLAVLEYSAPNWFATFTEPAARCPLGPLTQQVAIRTVEAMVLLGVRTYGESRRPDG